MPATTLVFSRRWLATLIVLALGIAGLARPLTSIGARSAAVANASSTKAEAPWQETRDGAQAVQSPQAVQASFTNSNTITVPNGASGFPGPATLYPSTITVSGLGTSLTSMSVKLNGFHHTQQKDVDCVLVGPTGAKFVFMSDVGGGSPGTPAIDLIFDDSGSVQAPITVISATATYKPTNSGSGDTFPAPAPVGPYNEAAPAGLATFASVYNTTNPNGDWKLYVTDDLGGDVGALDGGWTLTVSTGVAAGTTTTVSSSLNPSLTTNSVTFTAHVVKTSDSTNVTAGSVTFVDSSTGATLASNVALSGSGLASTSAIAGLVERRHLITATYNPDPAFLTSNGNMFQTVDFPTSNPSTGVYSNTNSLVTPESPTTQGPALQYPSHITVPAGVSGTISHLTVSLKNVTHSNAGDMDILLVGPAPDFRTIVLVSDAGNGSIPTSNVTVNFDDSAASVLGNSTTNWGATGSTVSSRPVDYTAGDTFPSPAPAGPYNLPAPNGSATLALFNGISPVGVWSLYVFDDVGGDTGNFSGGWGLTLTTTGDAATTTTVTSTANPSLRTQPITLTAQVKKTSDNSNVNLGTVTFREGATTLASGVALNGSGQAQFNAPANTLSESTHNITADYSGSAGNFNLSSGSINQVVDTPTTGVSPTFTNAGGITVPSSGASTPYASHITVSGLTGIVTKVTVQLTNLTHGSPPDLDVLLVGPLGQKVLLMSDCGNAVGATNVNLVFDDAGASVPVSPNPLISGTYKPTDLNQGDGDLFPAPAPGPAYGLALSAYNNTVPNGVWSLYIFDDAGAGLGTLASWSVTITTAPLTWNGSASSNWDTPANWTPNFAPLSTLDATIPASGVTNEPAISASDVSVNSLTIASGRTVTVNSGRTLTVNGTATVNGNFGGSGGIFNFNNLTIGNASGVTLGGNASVSGVLALTSGDLNMGANTLTQASTTASMGPFDVIGAVKRSNGASPLPAATVLTFGNPNNQLTFTAGTRPNEVTMLLAKTTPATFTSAVQRNYTITPSAVTAFTATLRLHYLDSELNSNTPESSLNLRRFNGTGWAPYPATTPVDTANNWVENNAVHNFSQWTFSKLSPTASGGTVTGRIVDDHGLPVEGAVVRLQGAQNRKFITDANGVYRFENVPTAGFYTVTPSRANYSFNPATRSFTQLGESTEAAFGATLLTSGFVNPLDTPEYFVRQHYIDFLGREPDEAGFNFWSDQIIECGGDQLCIGRKRENVSAAYFLSIEFQKTGGLVAGLYRASYGVAPQYSSFMPDTRALGNGVRVGGDGWEALLRANTEAFVNSFVNRAEFHQMYDGMADSLFVDTLIGHTGVSFTAAERDALVGGLGTGQMTRAEALRSIAENGRFVQAKFNETFVMMEYMGYLRRDPDAGGFAFWLNKLNEFNGNFEQAEMVKAFILSGEYRDRFPR
jgi:subtilisin-like proprotein convertase family protein